MNPKTRNARVVLIDLIWMAIAVLGFATACSLIVHTDKSELAFGPITDGAVAPGDGSMNPDGSSQNDGSAPDGSNDGGGNDGGTDGGMMCPATCPSDNNPCTNDVCDTAMGVCVNHYKDNDNDSYLIKYQNGVSGALCVCPGGNCVDCNDNDNTIFPGAPEICDGKSNQCPQGASDQNCETDTCANIGQAIALTNNNGVWGGTVTMGDFKYRHQDYVTPCDVGIAQANRLRDMIFKFEVPAGVNLTRRTNSGGSLLTVTPVTNTNIVVAASAVVDGCTTTGWLTIPDGMGNSSPACAANFSMSADIGLDADAGPGSVIYLLVKEGVAPGSNDLATSVPFSFTFKITP